VIFLYDQKNKAQKICESIKCDFDNFRITLFSINLVNDVHAKIVISCRIREFSLLLPLFSSNSSFFIYSRSISLTYLTYPCSVQYIKTLFF
jgi:hypothetical protein